MGGKAKGGQFERDICRELSLWWTGGRRDDIYWRTSTSGGRATSRAKKGKKTHGQYGDIQATDPRGAPFLRLFTVELKRGYPQASPLELLDSPGKKSMWLEFLKQVKRDARRAGSPYWMLIHKRDRKETLVYLPWEIAVILVAEYPVPRLSIHLSNSRVMATTLSEFLRVTPPKSIRTYR